MSATLAPVPAHVPSELVLDFDLYHPPGAEEDLHLAWKRLQDQGQDFVWTPRNGGHWIVTRGEDIDFILRDAEVFSSADAVLPPAPKPFRLLPLEADPPEHAEFRALVNPWFTPKAIACQEAFVRELAISLIEGIQPRSECEFISDFARHLPIAVFLRMVNVSLTHRNMLLECTEVVTRGIDDAARYAGHLRMSEFIAEVVAERRANPGDDLISRVVHGKVFGRRLNEEEITGMCLTVLFGGLDTVASMMGFAARFLAGNPGHRRQLIEHPEIISHAIDEIIRRHGISSFARMVARDCEYKGLRFLKDDRIYVTTMMYGLDERKFDRPLESTSAARM